MYKSIFKVAVVVSSVTSLQSQADGVPHSDEYYVSGSYGVSVNRNKPKYEDYIDTKTPTKESVFGASVGYKLDENLRAELKYTHFGSSKYQGVDTEGLDDVAKHKVKSKALFANLYYDFDSFGGDLVPYVTAGIGYAKNKAGTASVYDSDGDITAQSYEGDSKKSLAWNAGVGLSYKVNDQFTFDALQYNYVNLGKYTTKRYDADNGPLKGNIKVHTITTGIRISF